MARFLTEYVTGLAPAEPGYRTISIRPFAGHDLTSAHASVETPTKPPRSAGGGTARPSAWTSPSRPGPQPTPTSAPRRRRLSSPAPTHSPARGPLESPDETVGPEGNDLAVRDELSNPSSVSGRDYGPRRRNGRVGVMAATGLGRATLPPGGGRRGMRGRRGADCDLGVRR
ncbi:alpha-L-rhamnosidase C-terminal domain-containing protein [Streptomyces flaveolus]|uniref:alpha-L-rhamnosidase C-terminal domain-containing protein n=1 Tax=Streptomyces flaveolus TaxID=67297 RepID=UPI003F4E02BC